MRVRQLWNWIYVHGARDFARDDQSGQGFPRRRWRSVSSLARPEIVTEQISSDGTRKWLLRSGGQEFETVFIPEPGRGTLCVSSPGRLHAELPLLPHRHAEAGAQPDAGRDRRPGDGRARRARRLADRTAPEPPRHQRRDDGHGRAALQFREREGGAGHRGRRRRAGALQAPRHALHRGRRADDRARGATRSARRWRFRCTPCATKSATCWCRSTRNIR